MSLDRCHIGELDVFGSRTATITVFFSSAICGHGARRSDQGSQFTGHAWQNLLTQHGLVCSMSRRGNCHDNAVAESFFQLLKRERVRRRIYPSREVARADVFDYIEMFYNLKRRHSHNGGLSPVQFEQQRLFSGA